MRSALTMIFRRVALLSLLALLIPVSALRAADTAIPETFRMVAENEQFRLYVDSTNLAFKLLDQRSGYLWHSGIDERLEEDRLNRSWLAFARSGISVEYLDRRASRTRISIENATHTLDVTDIEHGIAARVTFEDFGITVGLHLQLEADGVRVELPFVDIQEANPDFRLSRVYVYPFLGATRGASIPGYMLLPDGIGSLVHFAESSRARNMFVGRYYGPDLGMLGIQPYNAEIRPAYPLTMPVYGMVHNEGQHALVSFIESGAAYGELHLHPSGIITNFNFLHHAFVYNETYFQATNRSGAGVTVVQRHTNRFDAVVHYRFLTGDQANYVGIARSYQDYLLQAGRLGSHPVSNPAMPIRLEFLAGDKEKVLTWHRFIPMTTITQIADILDRLQIPNPELIYYGWQPLGASSMPPDSLLIESGIGSLRDLETLADRVASDGGHFSLYLDPQGALWGEHGYSARTELAMAITNVAMQGYGRLAYYYFTLDALSQRYRTFTDRLPAQLNASLALDNIGFMLYSDYRQNPPFNREQAIAAYQRLLSEAPAHRGLYRPNDYFFSLAQAYYDMPISDNGYIFTTQTVPFLPVVLAGHIPYFGEVLNFSSNLREDLLRHVEYGVYPSYFLTQEPTSDMLNTYSAWIYTSSYEQWGSQVQRSYAWMNALLAPVRGQPIIAHQKLTRDVSLTTYANGRQVLVNYGDQPFAYAGRQVDAKDALLLEDGS